MAASRSSVDVRQAARLEGELRLPGDKSISHRALMLGLLSDGLTRIHGISGGADVLSTEGIARALGVEVSASMDGEIRIVEVRSAGVAGLVEPRQVLDCGNSGTTMRLLAGILAGLPFEATLDGDASLRARPMARIIEPLRAMGAEILGSGPDGAHAPLQNVGRQLHAIDWTTPVPSAQVKSAILLAGLAAGGTTLVREPVATRDHTERMLRARGVHVRSHQGSDGTNIVEVDGPARMRAVDQVVPGDPSAAAFWLVAAAIHPDAELRLRGVGVNPTRRAVIDLLRRMGASIDERGKPDDGIGEPIADLFVRSSELRAIEVARTETAAAIDEIPILCLAATQARGQTVIRGAGELRHKESDRIAGIVTGLTALGARISSVGDGIAIEGPTALRGGLVDSLGDHRLALTFAIAGLVADGATSIVGAESVGISYPSFFADLERIRS